MPPHAPVVIVTGAGQGIGYAIAHAFARRGATLALAEIDPARADAAAARLRQDGATAHAYPVDVTRKETIAAMVHDLEARYGRVDVLVNNAGTAVVGPSLDLPEESWRGTLDTLLTGTFFGCQAVAPGMMARGGGAIVNISSCAAWGGWPQRAAYNAAKAGVITLTEVLAVEWAPHHIRVNSVAPGVTQTEGTRAVLASGVAAAAQYERRIPLGRLAEPAEIAQAVLFLAGDEARYITGETLRVDGGWVAYQYL